MLDPVYLRSVLCAMGALMTIMGLPDREVRRGLYVVAVIIASIMGGGPGGPEESMPNVMSSGE